MSEPVEPSVCMNPQSDCPSPVPLQRNKFDASYVAQVTQWLGADACRRLAIYALPDAFRLTVIVPVYNECDTVQDVIAKLRDTGLPLEIILVDDGSDDGSSEVLSKMLLSDMSARSESTDGSVAGDVQLLKHDVNQGKGAAIRTGVAAASGDVIVIQDADSEYNPDDLRGLLQPLVEGSADVVYGTRYGHCDRQLSPWWHQAVNALITMLASIAIGPRLSDVETCYKMARAEHFKAVLPDLKEDRFGIEIELTARFARMGLRFTERPIRYQHRWYDEGKKITWKDGVAALYCIAKYGFFKR